MTKQDQSVIVSLCNEYNSLILRWERNVKARKRVESKAIASHQLVNYGQLIEHRHKVIEAVMAFKRKLESFSTSTSSVTSNVNVVLQQ